MIYQPVELNWGCFYWFEFINFIEKFKFNSIVEVIY